MVPIIITVNDTSQAHGERSADCQGPSPGTLGRGYPSTLVGERKSSEPEAALLRPTSVRPPWGQAHCWAPSAAAGVADTEPETRATGQLEPRPQHHTTSTASCSGSRCFCGRELCFRKLNSRTGCNRSSLRSILSAIWCVRDMGLTR